MKTTIIYESRFGNGKKCVETLSDILKDNGHTVDVYYFKDIDPKKVSESDVYIFSSPIRAFILPLGVRSFLKRFKPTGNSNKFALMTTHITEKPKALDIMEDILKSKGMEKVTNGFSARVLNTEGPLEKSYLQKLQDFSIELMTIIR